jgi:RNA polymerase sigma factor (sigma-70 family)
MFTEITNQEVPLSTDSKDELLTWLMEEYGDMVLRLAYTYVKQKQLAEDISQEVFISCYHHLNRFENRSSYKTWIYRITVNKCKDTLRSWSYKNITYKDMLVSLLKNGSKSTEAQLVDREEKEAIFEQVLHLPIKFREVIILFYYEELSIQEIAEMLNLNTNTIKTRLHRGRQALQVKMEGVGIHGTI